MNTYTTGSLCNDGTAQVLWGIPSRRFYILYDEFGLGVSDGWIIDRPIIYDDKSVGFTRADQLPQYIKQKFASLARRGLIKNCMNL